MNRRDLFKWACSIPFVGTVVQKCQAKSIEDTSFGFYRKGLSEHFVHNDDLRIGYEANIAMLLHDLQEDEKTWFSFPEGKRVRHLDFRDHETRNKVANRIMRLLFDNYPEEPACIKK